MLAFWMTFIIIFLTFCIILVDLIQSNPFCSIYRDRQEIAAIPLSRGFVNTIVTTVITVTTVKDLRIISL